MKEVNWSPCPTSPSASEQCPIRAAGPPGSRPGPAGVTGPLAPRLKPEGPTAPNVWFWSGYDSGASEEVRRQRSARQTLEARPSVEGGALEKR